MNVRETIFEPRTRVYTLRSVEYMLAIIPRELIYLIIDNLKTQTSVNDSIVGRSVHTLLSITHCM